MHGKITYLGNRHPWTDRYKMTYIVSGGALNSTHSPRIWGTETPEPIAIKFCIPGSIQDLITPANFGEDRLRGFGVARGRILAFSIDLLRLL